VAIYIYHGTHGFNRDARANYVSASAQIAFGRTQVIFKRAEWRRNMTMSLDAAAQVMREAMRGDGQAAFGISYLADILALIYPIASSLAVVRLLGWLAALGYLAWNGRES
jgi:hypothetical protein